MNKSIDTIIFDLGGVLIDWNPAYVYLDVFNGDQKKTDWFLNTICTMDWNVEQDAGRSFTRGTELLVNKYPQYEEWIRIYYDRWQEMLGGPITETVSILSKLKKVNSYRLYALTNWSDELFPIALQRYEFLGLFDGIVVSGKEKTRKPFPKIYNIILDRYKISPEKCVFIDDNFENIEAATKIGIHGIHYKSSKQLQSELNILGVKL